MDALEGIPFVVWAIVLPLAAAPLALVTGRRGGPLLALLMTPGIVLSVAGVAWQVWCYGEQRYPIGGWGAPLGIDLYADGLSALMLLMTAGVGTFVSLYAVGYFAGDADPVTAHGQGREYFWPLWLFLWGALNALFLSADVFNLYVTLELLTLSAVALVALAGEPAALVAAMRYLLAAVLGSLAYLIGIALLYAAYGTLDLAALGRALSPGMLSAAAIALVTLGLLLKTALFPLHFWLPPAHASAPAPVSALLSALVVKASFYLLLRLWFEVFPAALSPAVAQILGILGAAAIVWGSLQALLARRLKLLVAYSTVAQLGYLFLLFPLTTSGSGGFTAWSGGVFFALSHACAKAALFLAAGNVLFAAGHDDIDQLDGISQRLPMTFLTMGLTAVTLMGLPPSGAFAAKWMLLEQALKQGQGWLVAVMIGGGLLAAGYLFRVLQLAFSNTGAEIARPVPRIMEWAALILAVAALGLGFVAVPSLQLLRIGAPLTGMPLQEAAP
jgi:formate hydrogenlyase subunit 3/multisubunit Na+/H+ antiporter MnhD subunit